MNVDHDAILETLRQTGRTLAALADLLTHGSPPAVDYYTGATWPYGSARAMRAAIKSGRVAASRVGRELRVPREEADRAFAPRLRLVAPKKKATPKRESDRLRAKLEKAGVTR